MSAPIVISIGSTHPWNVAGTGRDLVVATELRARVFTATAGVTAQDARGLRAAAAIDPELLAAQLEALPWAAAGAIRVGALLAAAGVRLVASALRAHPGTPAIVDPVFATSRGGSLADDATRAALALELAILPNVVLTPNLDEAAVLLGCPPLERGSIRDAAAALQARGAHAVLLKGGHLQGDPADAFATAAGVELLSEPRIAASMRGTGCTLAMAFACELARGSELEDAVRSARAYVRLKLA
ncbi:MAG TPA: bifunctional hydroxymethylpyrimidine kinase/phosphomethylpyrimidine kinase, partial [Verrucomicrobiae bacterium]|nr:bifunctional hydroxymethylpyrimidine kinase/phosphomethylpyrimidine kinase [Verrucomicrobiae bacterium]